MREGNLQLPLWWSNNRAEVCENIHVKGYGDRRGMCICDGFHVAKGYPANRTVREQVEKGKERGHFRIPLKA